MRLLRLGLTAVLLAACSSPPIATPLTETSVTTVAEVTTTTRPLTTTTTVEPATTTTSLPVTTTTLPPKPVLPEAVVGGLVVSVGQPPAEVVERYADFGGNVVALWEAEEAKYWLDYPAIVWASEDGRQTNDPTRRDLLSPLELSPNVVAVQVGDEPPEAAPARLDLPVSEHTNFSWWAPDKDGNLDEMLADYQGDRLSTSDYHLTPGDLHYTILKYFRDHALRLDIPYWHYLNAYVGSETDNARVHQPSDLAWTAFSGAVFGYTGHIWFSYQFGTQGHDAAIAHGGSVFYTAPGEWTETALWEEGARINRGLLAMTERLVGHTSTSVDWEGNHPFGGSQLLVGGFGEGLWAVLNSRHAFAGSDEPIAVTMPFQAEVWDAQTQNTTQVQAGGVITLNAGWAVLVREVG